MTGSIIPFGKYKGRSIDEVAQRDPQYLEWLTQQAWFEERFDHLSNSIGFRAEDTPEHNAMQVKFLDERLRWQVAKAVTGDGPIELDKMASEARTKLVAELTGLTEDVFNPKPTTYFEENSIHWAGYLRQLEEWEKRIFNGKMAFEEKKQKNLRWLEQRPMRKLACEPVFECGVDVGFSIYAEWYVAPMHWRLNHNNANEFLIPKKDVWHNLAVECKPTVGDDFPAILRQVTKQKVKNDDHRKVLFVGEYSARGATREQFVKMFANSGITVLFQTEVEALEV